jgi:hypothetical protein
VWFQINACPVCKVLLSADGTADDQPASLCSKKEKHPIHDTHDHSV